MRRSAGSPPGRRSSPTAPTPRSFAPVSKPPPVGCTLLGGAEALLTDPTIYVISGTQGAGKSTVARLLAERLERAAWVSPDHLQRMIVAGGRWPEGREMSTEAARQLRLRLANACALAGRFVDAGFSVAIDDLVIGDRVDHLLAEMGDRSFVFVMLTPRLEVVRAREAGRGTELWREWEWLDDEIRTQTRRIGLWLDSSDHTPEETVAEILRRGPTEGLVTSRSA